MSKTIVGLFDEKTSADSTVRELNAANIAQDNVMTVDKSTVSGALMGTLTDAGVPEGDAQTYAAGVKKGETLVMVETADANGHLAVEIMDRNNSIDIDKERDYYMGSASVAAAGAAALTTAKITPAAKPMPATTSNVADGEMVIPIVEEQLQVGKRIVQRGGTRIHTRAIEKAAQAQVSLHEEHVGIERHAVNRAVAANDNAFKDGVVEVTTTDEVPVVSKTARVVEEVVVGKVGSDHTETINDTVRRTDVEVEKVGAGSANSKN